MLAVEIEKTISRDANVFSMRVHHGSQVFEFLTTSKDVFLALGRFDDEGRKLIAEALHTEMKKTNTNQLLWQFRQKESRPELCTKKSLVVTQTDGQDYTVLTFAPA